MDAATGKVLTIYSSLPAFLVVLFSVPVYLRHTEGHWVAPLLILSVPFGFGSGLFGLYFCWRSSFSLPVRILFFAVELVSILFAIHFVYTWVFIGRMLANANG
jgi:hypothetical protein